MGAVKQDADIRLLAWYIWQYLRRTSWERPAIENWVLAERYYKHGDFPKWLQDGVDFTPFSNPNAGA